jgi:hypothetical protein
MFNNNLLLLLAVGLLLFFIMNPSLIPNEGEVAPEVAKEVVAEVAKEVVPEVAPVLNNLPSEVTPENVAIPQPAPEAEKPTVAQVAEVTGLSGKAGASLDTAFIGAIAPGTAIDEIDFTKNNVTEYDSSQFLPKEVNDEWFETDFTQAKYNLNDDKLINTNRYIIGVNTVGQSLKNPSYDIRGTIPNPKYTVSPWMNSTYEPDTNIKPLY